MRVQLLFFDRHKDMRGQEHAQAAQLYASRHPVAGGQPNQNEMKLQPAPRSALDVLVATSSESDRIATSTDARNYREHRFGRHSVSTAPGSRSKPGK